MDYTKFSISEGNHEGLHDGTCIMEAISVIAGDEFTDHPMCVATPLINLAITLNDHDNTTTRLRNRWLRPLIPCLMNTTKLVPIRLGSKVCLRKDSQHSIKVRAFMEKRWREVFNAPLGQIPGVYSKAAAIWTLFYRTTPNRTMQKRWKKAVAILAEGAAYAKELLGPPFADKVECCSSEFLDLLKGNVKPAEKKELEKA